MFNYLLLSLYYPLIYSCLFWLYASNKNVTVGPKKLINRILIFNEELWLNVEEKDNTTVPLMSHFIDYYSTIYTMDGETAVIHTHGALKKKLN